MLTRINVTVINKSYRHSGLWPKSTNRTLSISARRYSRGTEDDASADG